jgi:hypothetical protein
MPPAVRARAVETHREPLRVVWEKLRKGARSAPGTRFGRTGRSVTRIRTGAARVALLATAACTARPRLARPRCARTCLAGSLVRSATCRTSRANPTLWSLLSMDLEPRSALRGQRSSRRTCTRRGRSPCRGEQRCGGREPFDTVIAVHENTVPAPRKLTPVTTACSTRSGSYSRLSLDGGTSA